MLASLKGKLGTELPVDIRLIRKSRAFSYLTAKFLMLAAVAALQTLIFWGCLWSIRRWHEPGLHTFPAEPRLFPLSTIALLLLVSWNGVGLGLLLSAWSGRNKERASFALPLVILLQIVCSVQVATSAENNTTKWAYLDHGFLLPRDPTKDPPPATIVAASYFTISRYADIALRSYAYGPSQAAGSPVPPQLQAVRALWWLGAWIPAIQCMLMGGMLRWGSVLRFSAVQRHTRGDRLSRLLRVLPRGARLGDSKA